MAEHSMVHAPYNFVPFSKVLLRYPSPEELPRHDCLDPALKSGEIHVTMTADTPVFVSDGNKNDPHFFRTPGGAYALPGSTIRGMVRENMQKELESQPSSDPRHRTAFSRPPRFSATALRRYV